MWWFCHYTLLEQISFSKFLLSVVFSITLSFRHLISFSAFPSAWHSTDLQRNKFTIWKNPIRVTHLYKQYKHRFNVHQKKKEIEKHFRVLASIRNGIFCWSFLLLFICVDTTRQNRRKIDTEQESIRLWQLNWDKDNGFWCVRCSLFFCY